MSKYGIFTYGIRKRNDFNSKERLKKTVESLINQINFNKKIKKYLLYFLHFHFLKALKFYFSFILKISKNIFLIGFSFLFD